MTHTRTGSWRHESFGWSFVGGIEFVSRMQDVIVEEVGERLSNAGKVLPPVVVVPGEQTCEVLFLPVGVMVTDDPVHMGADVEPTCH